MIMPVEQKEKKNDVNTVYKINGTIKKTNVHYECPKRKDQKEYLKKEWSNNELQAVKLRGAHQDVL